MGWMIVADMVRCLSVGSERRVVQSGAYAGSMFFSEEKNQKTSIACASGQSEIQPAS
jgi:hypothetical protein